MKPLRCEFNHRQGTSTVLYTRFTPTISLHFLADSADISQERMGDSHSLSDNFLRRAFPDPNSLRTFAPGLGQIFSLQNVADSNYNAMQVTLRRATGPLTLGVAYT